MKKLIIIIAILYLGSLGAVTVFMYNRGYNHAIIASGVQLISMDVSPRAIIFFSLKVMTHKKSVIMHDLGLLKKKKVKGGSI